MMRELHVAHAGQVAIVRHSSGHPEQYLYIELLEPGMTRGDVKRMAVEWMRRSDLRAGQAMVERG